MTSSQQPHPAALDEPTLLKQCEIRRQRRSGPGGQHRNKVETAVVIRHKPTGVSAEATERRSQIQNRRMALLRLRINLAIEVRQPVCCDAGPSAIWQSRVQAGRIAVNPSHHDFPALLAEALDVLADHRFDIKLAAEWLDVTTSQLAKFLQVEFRARQQVNEARSHLGLRPLS